MNVFYKITYEFEFSKNLTVALNFLEKGDVWRIDNNNYYYYFEHLLDFFLLFAFNVAFNNNNNYYCCGF